MNEKIAEAGAVSWAVWSSACNSCRYLPQCESDDSFRFPNPANVEKARKRSQGASQLGGGKQ